MVTFYPQRTVLLPIESRNLLTCGLNPRASKEHTCHRRPNTIAKVRLPGVPETIPGGQNHTTESQPDTEVASSASQEAFCNTNAAGGIGDQPKDGTPSATTTPVGGAGAMSASPTRTGNVKAEDIAIDQTDMAWSGSVHCM